MSLGCGLVTVGLPEIDLLQVRTRIFAAKRRSRLLSEVDVTMRAWGTSLWAAGLWRRVG